MRVIIAGSRTIRNYGQVVQAIEASGWRRLITEVVCGMARGVDTLGLDWAAHQGDVAVTEFPADWEGKGRGAGPIRNQEMADYAKAYDPWQGGAGLILVWDGQSRGSADIKKRARAAGLPVFEDRAGTYYLDDRVVGGRVARF